MKKITLIFLLMALCAADGFCGINNTLLDAQAMFKRAETVEEYTEAKKKFESARYDISYVEAEHEAAIQEGIRKCEERINELKPRLTVNGHSSSLNISFDSGGGTKVLTIDTNQGTVSASALPSWIDEISTTSSSLTIRCGENSSTSSRGNWFNVNAGSMTVRVNVSQSGKPAPSKSATIKSVRIKQTVLKNGIKGLTTHVELEIFGAKNLDCRVVTYFYDANGNALKDLNGKYCTNEDEPKVSSGINIKPSSDDELHICAMFIPYSELHLSGNSTKNLYVDVRVWDISSKTSKLLGIKNNTSFRYTPHAPLTVDNQTQLAKSFPYSGGEETFEVSTDGDSWTTWGVPSWCGLTTYGNSFTLKCRPNSSTQPRSDYMKIKTDNHEVRIDITQAGKPGPNATITSVEQEHNVFNGFVKGMRIIVKYEVNGLKGKNVTCTAWFYYEDNTTRLNNPYGGQVQVSHTDNSPYESTLFTTRMFMPYNSLNMAPGFNGSLSFDVVISYGNQTLACDDNNGFTYTQGYY